jgi:FHA domain
MICSSCGSLIPEKDLICRKCGKAVETRLEGGTRLSETRIGGTATPTRIYSTNESARTVVYAAPQEEIKPLLGWLVVIEGKGQWKEFRISKKDAQVLIGNSEECIVCLEDETLNPRHASLRVKDEKISLTDLDSSSGTFLNGEVITKVELKDNDEIKLGGTVLKFRRL